MLRGGSLAFNWGTKPRHEDLAMKRPTYQLLLYFLGCLWQANVAQAQLWSFPDNSQLNYTKIPQAMPLLCWAAAAEVVIDTFPQPVSRLTNPLGAGDIPGKASQ